MNVGFISDMAGSYRGMGVVLKGPRHFILLLDLASLHPRHSFRKRHWQWSSSVSCSGGAAYLINFFSNSPRKSRGILDETCDA